ncbi:sterigmatocystin 8-O-methyltransferase [Colletotrichum tofieldiae]|nr:sterigmatocystin 8-O-methyltransferase [Colletotrichum tofieldiae]
MCSHMPEFLAKTGYKNPKNNRNTIFDSAFNWEGGAFKYWKEHPAQGEAFNIVQKVSTSSQTRLYLEDIPSVIADENSTVVKGINKVPYDFFTPQPIKRQDARAYYMHHVLHDWPDRQARKILEMQKAAMKPGYSKLLIHDQVMNDDGPVHPHAAGLDIGMMLFGSAQERTEKEWESLITSAGLKIVKIWRIPSAPQGIIEAELASEKSKL